MKLTDLPIGTEIKHFRAGKLITATISEIHRNHVLTTHPPVEGEKNTYTTTKLVKSKAKHDKAFYPIAFIHGKRITEF